MRAKGDQGLAVFVMFDEEAERLAPELGLRIAHPPAALRKHIDSKTVTTRLAAEAGVPSVPNTLARVGSYEELTAAATRAGLGDDLVVQTPYGDSGRTTFFIHGQRDWDKAAKAIVAEDEVKVMRRVNVRAGAIEATITRHGTIVGPLMTDLTGFKELTPYKGGWCGNDMWPGVLRSVIGVGRESSSSGSGTAWPRRATSASSRSTSWPTPTPTSSTWARSTRASAARHR